MPIIPPLGILVIGIAIVLGLILVLRINAFFALLAAAVVVSLLAPGVPTVKIPRVAEALGVTAGKIGISIAMAAIIGKCMLESGAADRIALAFLRLFGEQRGGLALTASGFTLSIPVFFDTVFYLLFPIAKSMHRRTRRNYLKYVLAVAVGGNATHTLVPPTPGPLAVAGNLGVDLGIMILMGIIVGLPIALFGLWFASLLDQKYDLSHPPEYDDEDEVAKIPVQKLPSLFAASLPIVLPVVLIAAQTIVSQGAIGADASSRLVRASDWLAIWGNPNLALMLAAAVAVFVCWLQARSNPQPLGIAQLMEQSIIDAGPIILITAAGGAFGEMLKLANVTETVQLLVSDESAPLSGHVILWLAFAVASLLKFAQGSTTVAMITASSMLAAMLTNVSLPFDKVYIALAVGCGTMVGIWMNDSGFWILSKMSGLTPRETLKSWSLTAALSGFVGMLMLVLLSTAMPTIF
jgi:gluconate:H+ symporter, GntP family